MLRIESFAITDVGVKRDHNEDYYGIDEEFELYVVADGMGGHASGEVASRLAVENLMEFFTRQCRAEGFKWPYPVDGKASTFEEVAVSNAVQYANDRVFIESMKDRRYDDMGTTLCMAAGAGDRIVIAHVGDSRVYRYRAGELVQVTEDHSLLNHYIRTRGLTEEEIKSFKSKNVIVRAVGLKDYVEPDVQIHDKRAGDIYLLCSDGLSDLVDDWIIQEVIRGDEDDLTEIGATLVRLANQAGGKDNITVMLLRIEGDPEDLSAPLSANVPYEELDSTDLLFDGGSVGDDRTQPHPVSFGDELPFEGSLSKRRSTERDIGPRGTHRIDKLDPGLGLSIEASSAKPRPAEPEASPRGTHRLEKMPPGLGGNVGAGGRIGVTVSSGEVEVPTRRRGASHPVAAPAPTPAPPAQTNLRDTQPVPTAEVAEDPTPEPAPLAAPPVDSVPAAATEPALHEPPPEQEEGPAPVSAPPAYAACADEELAALLASARPGPIPGR